MRFMHFHHKCTLFPNEKMNIMFQTRRKLEKNGIGYSWTEIGKFTGQILGIRLELGLRFPEFGTTSTGALSNFLSAVGWKFLIPLM